MQTLSQSRSADTASFGQLFGYPFRIFFLSLTVLALIAIPLWLLVVTGALDLPLALPGVFWHQHEMLFGFLSAAIAGFLLTAVCVWTQTERMHGARLVALWLVWLAGRLLLALGGDLPVWLVQGVNLAFFPLIVLDAGWRVWHARQRRQLMLMVVLGLLWAMQIGFVFSFDRQFVAGGLVMAMALISIVGGRITPAFSAGWLRGQGGNPEAVKIRPRLDLAVLLSMIALLATLLVGWTPLIGIVALVSSVLMLIRLAGWKGWLTRAEPLLWSLHLSMLWIPVSLALLAGDMLLGWSGGAWLHAAGVGAVGGLILAVIARVTLGHTGRAMVLPKGMVLAFIAIHVATLVRVVTALEGLPWMSGLFASAVLWELAFLLFLLRYTSILASPRVDGKPG